MQLDDDIGPCATVSQSTVLSLADELKAEYQKQLTDIMEKCVELGKKEQLLRDKEQLINAKTEEVKWKSKENDEQEQSLYMKNYRFHCDVVSSGHCEEEYAKAMGQAFWEDNLQDAIIAGAKIGRGEHEVKQEISYAMVSIYEDLEVYDKAYDFLVEQATRYSWLNLSTVQNIVKKVGCCDRLKSALYTRLSKNDLSFQDKSDFEKIKNWLIEYNR